MLLEGFGYPPLSIASIVTRMKSPVKFTQFIGRVQQLVQQLVRWTRPDGTEQIEENVNADVFTHKHFKQEELITKYSNPTNPDEEDESLDAPL